MRSILRSMIRLLCQLYPIYSGPAKIANSILFRYLSKTSNPIVLTKLRDGSPILVNLNDFIGRTIYYFGDYDLKVTEICRRLLRPGDTVVDVGANCGVVTIYSSRLVGPKGHIYAIEPQPDLAVLIQKSAAIGGYSQVSVHSIALSDCDGTMNLAIPEDNSGKATLMLRNKFPYKTIQVQTKKASDYISSLSLGLIHLMKVDAEGYEYIIIKDVLESLRERSPDIILFEE